MIPSGRYPDRNVAKNIKSQTYVLGRETSCWRLSYYSSLKGGARYSLGRITNAIYWPTTTVTRARKSSVEARVLWPGILSKASRLSYMLTWLQANNLIPSRQPSSSCHEIASTKCTAIVIVKLNTLFQKGQQHPLFYLSAWMYLWWLSKLTMHVLLEGESGERAQL